MKQKEEKSVFSDIKWKERKMEESYDFSGIYVYSHFLIELVFKGNIGQFGLFCLSKVLLWKVT